MNTTGDPGRTIRPNEVMVMTDLLERTHHEPLVVARLHTTAEHRDRTTSPAARRRTRTVAAIAVAVVAALFMWAERAGDTPAGDAPAPTAVLPSE